MNKKLVLCGIATAMTAFSFVACEDDDDNNNNGGEPTEVKLEGSLVDTSDPRTNIPQSDTIASYSFNMQKKEGTLQLLDVFLPSCPNAKYTSDFEFKNDSIKIKLADDISDSTLCGAPLYRDFTYKISGLESKKYNVAIFTEEGISIQSFDLDLSKFDNGAILAEKQPEEALKGAFISRSGCKGHPEPNGLRSGEIDTIATYNFNLETKNGEITVLRQAFDCCALAISEITTNGDTIFINFKRTEYIINENGEQEENPVCKCLCTFDITSQIVGINKKKYHVVTKDEYSSISKSFDIDLNEATSGVIVEVE